MIFDYEAFLSAVESDSVHIVIENIDLHQSININKNQTPLEALANWCMRNDCLLQLFNCQDDGDISDAYIEASWRATDGSICIKKFFLVIRQDWYLNLQEVR